MNAEQQVLVIGTKNVGKTCYAAQVFRRLQEGLGQLTLSGTPEQLTLLQDAIDRISRGLPPVHTPSEQHDHIEIPLALPDRTTLQLVWPDYGGEQITTMLESRAVPLPWVQRSQTSSAWLLFIRLDSLDYPSTVLDRMIKKREVKPKGTKESEVVPPGHSSQWDPNAYYVELLQMLLYARHHDSLHFPLPRLGVVLTCWDKLQCPENTKPEVVLQKRLPVLHAFIESTWQEGIHTYFGLAATGQDLATKEPPAQEWLNDWIPEDAGFVILESGSQLSDLTLPVLWGVQ